MPFFARGRDERRLRAELTVAEPTARQGPEVAPPSVVRGHNVIKVRKPPSTATGPSRVIRLVSQDQNDSILSKTWTQQIVRFIKPGVHTPELYGLIRDWILAQPAETTADSTGESG